MGDRKCDGRTKTGAPCRIPATVTVSATAFTAKLSLCRRCDRKWAADWRAWRAANIPDGE